jgi:hypothetical protein
MEKPKPLHAIGTQTVETQKAERIRTAAELSREKPPADICRQLDISFRTLKRYEKDPRWKAYGGVDLPKYFTTAGRPRRDPETDKALLQEANRRHNAGEKWINIADQLGLTIRQLEYLRSKARRTS